MVARVVRLGLGDGGPQVLQHRGQVGFKLALGVPELLDLRKLIVEEDPDGTGKTTPDGKPDPSIFSTPGDPVGIQVGTAIATLVRKTDHAHAEAVGFRHLWGQAKLSELTGTAEADTEFLYDPIEPVMPLGLPFVSMPLAPIWSEWPSLPELFPVSFPGVKTSRDSFLVDIDLGKLKTRVQAYFDSVKVQQPGPNESGFIRYACRPFDTRWLYWEADSGLLDRPRPN